MSECIGCQQAKTQQQVNDERVIQIAKERAISTGTTVSLYRDPEGTLCIVPDDGNWYPVCRQVTPIAQ